MEAVETVAEQVRVRRDGGVAWVTLDRPPLNVLNMALMAELEAALRELRTDGTLRLIVLEGAGRGFSAGVDVGEHMGDSIGPMLDAFTRVAAAVLEGDAPVMAVVHGAALGGACELVALCDLAIVADDARIGTPEITLAVVPPVGAALFPLIVGRQRAAALVLTGDPISGADAAAWGLVWRSVPAADLRAEAEKVAAGFEHKSAAAVALGRRSLRVSTDALRGAIDRANALSVDALPGSADAQEGLRAFLEKRPPHWTHR
jgi:cyclohexa-1,5-dienecarbonyl-CoA hydratase